MELEQDRKNDQSRTSILTDRFNRSTRPYSGYDLFNINFAVRQYLAKQTREPDIVRQLVCQTRDSCTCMDQDGAMPLYLQLHIQLLAGQCVARNRQANSCVFGISDQRVLVDEQGRVRVQL